MVPADPNQPRIYTPDTGAEPGQPGVFQCCQVGPTRLIYRVLLPAAEPPCWWVLLACADHELDIGLKLVELGGEFQ